ncbi:MAG: type I pullulanase [Lachnospiraceae bacterium]|nr:type I pullulanase [Lachnospiraceae bacterium]
MTVSAEENPTLKLHYHREDGSYEGWDVWLWDEGGEGAAYPFEEEEGEMVATKEITPDATKIGFIVRTQDWTKDFDGDQFIDVSEMVSGTVHVYVESGVEGYTKEYDDDVVTGIKIRSAVYDDEERTVMVTMTGAIEGDVEGVFSVSGKEGEAAVSGVKELSAGTYLVTLEQELDAAKSYKISYKGTDYDIYLPSVYSTAAFEDAYTYGGDDLGAVWSEEETAFRVWAPTAESVMLNLYESGDASKDDSIERLEMTADVNGTWTVQKDGDIKGVYYTYSVTIDGVEREACDPYARTTGVNGARAMVIDLDGTDPEGWADDANPHAGKAINDAVIYELHVRDLSAGADSGIENAGKFLGLAETGTTTASGIPTGLDHMKDLGVTHVHLLPIYDFGSVDETGASGSPYNWGYDPVNYNVPEGSYATDPYQGDVRVKELKQAVKGLHDNGISVVMDVVYNHVYSAADFCFNKIVPDYFSRTDKNGAYSNGSGCGNDTASERSMVKKYIVDSVSYWADEYHIDGFRFDLVGLLDTETINAIIEEVHKDHPDVIFYGEGWTMSTALTKGGYTLATQVNSEQTPEFAYFNDTIRDGLKGSVFDAADLGYASGRTGIENAIMRCFLGADTWCSSPSQTVNYASCHDNLTLFDHLQTSRPEADEAALIKMNNLAAAVYITAEGVPFMQAGEEMLRTKVKDDGTFDSNSYSSGDLINALKWSDLDKEAYAQVYEYYKGLIAFRKAHDVLRLGSAEEVAASVKTVEDLDANVLAFDIRGGESAEQLFVIFNANETETSVTLPDGTWNVYINAEKAGTEILDTVTGGSLTVEPVSAMILIKTGDAVSAADQTADTSENTETESANAADDTPAKRAGSNKPALIIGIAAAIAGGGLALGSIWKRRRKDS